VTGLSILRLTKKNAVAASAFKDEPVNIGEAVLLYRPEPVQGTRPLVRPRSTRAWPRLKVDSKRFSGAVGRHRALASQRSKLSGKHSVVSRSTRPVKRSE
jgi:hypothetical protein